MAVKGGRSVSTRVRSSGVSRSSRRGSSCSRPHQLVLRPAGFDGPGIVGERHAAGRSVLRCCLGHKSTVCGRIVPKKGDWNLGSLWEPGFTVIARGGGRRVCSRRAPPPRRRLQDATLAAYLAELTSLRRIPDEEEPRDHGAARRIQEGEDAGRAVREGRRRPGGLPTSRPGGGETVRGRLTSPPSSSPTTGAAWRAVGVESEKRSRSRHSSRCSSSPPRPNGERRRW